METESTLLKLHEHNVVGVELSDDLTELMVMELCDYFYQCPLNKQELGILINELKEIHNRMIEK